MRKLALIAAISLLGGCASHPDNISATYTIDMKYNSYSCPKLASEFDYVSGRTTELYQSLMEKRENDNIQIGLGMLLFWPALFFLEGSDGPEAIEYSKLKGNFEAMRTAFVKKSCDLEQIVK